MYWVYLLKSTKVDKLYFGTTNNLQRRLSEHNHGKSRFTKSYAPWRLVYLEGYASKSDALVREANLKYFGKAYGQLKRRIVASLRDV